MLVTCIHPFRNMSPETPQGSGKGSARIVANSEVTPFSSYFRVAGDPGAIPIGAERPMCSDRYGPTFLG